MFSEFFKKHKLPSFRQRQLNKSFYQEAIFDFSELNTWPKDLRDQLKQEVPFMSLDVDKELVSKRGDTVKVLFRRKIDGQRIEAVLMQHEDGRNTVCVSCMVGCPVNCSFCATGKMGYGGSLTTQEIIDQVMYFQRYLHKKGQKVTNVVFMGMGEPLLNLKEVEPALKILNDPEKIALGQKRITISTSGYIPQFEQLIANGFRGRVAISLHAPNQELRAKLMPVAKIYPLDKLLATLDNYVKMTNKRITYEYIMIKGVNDGPEHAQQLGDLFKKRLAHINLIPYNPIREVDFERSEQKQIDRFRTILDLYHINHTTRMTMGDDVDAACGQLADRENQKNQLKRIRI